MKTLEYIYSKKEILEILNKPKYFKDGILKDIDIDRRMKIKPNNPAFYSLELELNDGFLIKMQHNNDNEFPKYAAILLFNKTLICRLDYHDGHRRKCKKEIFLNEVYENLHIHLYCKDCIKEKFKSDSFVLNIKENKLLSFDFKCFIALFCKIISLRENLDCQKGLF